MWSGLRPTYSLNSFMLQGCSGKETRTRSLGPTRHDTRTSTYFSETATTTETDTTHSNQRNPIVARRNRQRTLPNVMLSTRSYRPSANTFPAIAPTERACERNGHSTDDAQRFQTEQYPLLHARRLLRAAPSTRLVLRSVDQDVFGDIVAAVF